MRYSFILLNLLIVFFFNCSLFVVCFFLGKWFNRVNCVKSYVMTIRNIPKHNPINKKTYKCVFVLCSALAFIVKYGNVKNGSHACVQCAVFFSSLIENHCEIGIVNVIWNAIVNKFDDKCLMANHVVDVVKMMS